MPAIGDSSMTEILVHETRVLELHKFAEERFGFFNLRSLGGARRFPYDLNEEETRAAAATLMNEVISPLLAGAREIRIFNPKVESPSFGLVQGFARKIRRNLFSIAAEDLPGLASRVEFWTETAGEIGDRGSVFLAVNRTNPSVDQFLAGLWDPAIVSNLKSVVGASTLQAGKQLLTDHPECLVIALLRGSLTDFTVFEEPGKIGLLVEHACRKCRISLPYYAEPAPA